MEHYIGHIILVFAGMGMACGGYMEILGRDRSALAPVVLGLIGLSVVGVTFAIGLIQLGEQIR